MKRGLTTDEAFKEMINTRGIYKTLGVADGEVRRIRFDFNKGLGNISLSKKIDLLQKAGYPVAQELRWDTPN